MATVVRMKASGFSPRRPCSYGLLDSWKGTNRYPLVVNRPVSLPCPSRFSERHASHTARIVSWAFRIFRVVEIGHVAQVLPPVVALDTVNVVNDVRPFLGHHEPNDAVGSQSDPIGKMQLAIAVHPCSSGFLKGILRIPRVATMLARVVPGPFGKHVRRSWKPVEFPRDVIIRQESANQFVRRQFWGHIGHPVSSNNYTVAGVP